MMASYKRYWISIAVMIVVIMTGTYLLFGATPNWIQYNERVVGENSPLGYTDVANRPAKEIWSNFTSEHNLTGTHKSSATALIPAGTIWMYGGAVAPDDWLICDGSAVSRSTYSTLYANISTIYGSGDGTTTFNLPDMRGRSPIGEGQGSGLTDRSLGDTVGEEDHSLSSAENGAHAHTTGSALAGSGSVGYTVGPYAGTFSTSTEGSGTAHNTMQPSLTVNFIIKY